MAMTPSNMLPLGTPLPRFSLPDGAGKVFENQDVKKSAGTLVMFICNHCPYVKHIAPSVSEVSSRLLEQGVGVVAINSNDFIKYPDDSPEHMLEEVKRRGYKFPYLVDQTQKVAKAFNAACTPEFYLFDGSDRLFYRGQWDGSRPGNDVPVTGEEITAAVAALLKKMPPPQIQKPSVGCNIKWLPNM